MLSGIMVTMNQQLATTVKDLSPTDLLIEMGDFLNSIDDVREWNGAGFNKPDKQGWPRVRGNTVNMQKLLAKYRRQLGERFGEDAVGVLQQELQPGPACGYLWLFGDRIRFESRDLGDALFAPTNQVLREHGFRFDWNIRRWLRQPAGFNLEQFGHDIQQLGLVFGGDLEAIRAAVLAAPVPAPQSVVQKAVNRLRTVTVTRDSNGMFAFTSPFSREFNEIFSNKSGVLSGITEYNPQNHARQTYDIELVMEAIGKIQERMPGWQIEQYGVEEAWETYQLEQEQLSQPIPEVAQYLAPGFQLFNYQNQMVRFLQQAGGNAIVGDDMGLGKTLQSLSYAVSVGIDRILVVCPKVVRRTWLKEAAKFFPAVFDGRTLELTPKLLKKKVWDLQAKPKIASCNYESVGKFQEFVDSWQPQMIIVDESHRIKNDKTLAFRDVVAAARGCEYRLLMSGTAIKNKKSELFTQVEMVKPGLFSSAEELLMATIGGAWNRLRSCYLARQKEKVLKDLPDKLRSVVNVEVDGIEAIPMPEGFEQIAAAKARIALAKVPATIEFIKEILNGSDSACLVFTDSVEAAEQIAAELGEQAMLHHGQMTDDARERVKEDFQNGRGRVFVSTRQSLAVGATLTRADRVIFSDLPWTISDALQAEDRAYRIGQTKTVNVYWIVADNHPWDRYVARILAKKMDLCKRMNQGQQLTAEEREFMTKAVTVPRQDEIEEDA